MNLYGFNYVVLKPERTEETNDPCVFVVVVRLSRRATSSRETDLKDLGEVCVSVGEHGVDAVDGVLGLARWPPLGLGLQYWQQDTRGHKYKVKSAHNGGINKLINE